MPPYILVETGHRLTEVGSQCRQGSGFLVARRTTVTKVFELESHDHADNDDEKLTQDSG